MRKIYIVLLVGFFLVGYNSLVFGQIKFDSGTSRTLGGTTFHNYTDGTSGTSRTLGGTTFYNNSDGTSGTSRNLGGTTFHNLNRRR